MKEGLGCLGIILLFLGVVFALALVEGLVIFLLWNLVICAIFTSMTPITFWLAVGVGLVLGFIQNLFRVRTKTDD